MQMRVMNIICSYLRYDHMSDDEMIMNALEFTNVFDGAIAVTNDVTRSIAKILSKNTMPAFNEMHQLLDLLNGCAANRSIFSLPIKSMRSAMRMSGIGIQKVMTICLMVVFMQSSKKNPNDFTGKSRMDAFKQSARHS